MDKTTHEIRISNWRSIIEQCRTRPEGHSEKQWLADNDISEKTYYYRQRKVQQEIYALIRQDAVPKAMPSSDTPSVMKKGSMTRIMIKIATINEGRKALRPQPPFQNIHEVAHYVGKI